MANDFSNDVLIPEQATKTKWAEMLTNFLTTKQLALMFQVTPMTILSWRNNLGLRAYKIGFGDRRLTLFSIEEVTEWANANGKPICFNFTNSLNGALKGS